MASRIIISNGNIQLEWEGYPADWQKQLQYQTTKGYNYP